MFWITAVRLDTYKYTAHTASDVAPLWKDMEKVLKIGFDTQAHQLIRLMATKAHPAGSVHHLQYSLPPAPEALHSKASGTAVSDASPEGTATALKTFPIPWLSRDICHSQQWQKHKRLSGRGGKWRVAKRQLQSTVCTLVNHQVVTWLLSAVPNRSELVARHSGLASEEAEWQGQLHSRSCLAWIYLRLFSMEHSVGAKWNKAVSEK